MFCWRIAAMLMFSACNPSGLALPPHRRSASQAVRTRRHRLACHRSASHARGTDPGANPEFGSQAILGATSKWASTSVPCASHSRHLAGGGFRRGSSLLNGRIREERGLSNRGASLGGAGGPIGPSTPAWLVSEPPAYEPNVRSTFNLQVNRNARNRFTSGYAFCRFKI